VTGEIVTAALLNEQIKDNGLLTAPAIMTTAGDIMYASAANTPARLAKSTTSTQYLANTGTSNVPAWNEVALATGVSGTLPVGNGGTGATTLTANGALIGNGTSSIASVDMSTKGGLLAGDGSGNPSVLAVGGSNDHVLTVDSGEATGMKWAAVGGLSAASVAEMEAASSNTVAATPGRTQNHPGVAKAWCRITDAGALTAGDYNIASVTDTATGNRTIVIDNDFSNDTYVGFATGATFHTETAVEYGTFNAGDVGMRTFNPNGGALVDYATSSVFLGDQ
jgi:hypothetical protein